MSDRPGDSEAHVQDSRLLAAIVASSDDAIISKSLDGIIQSWNSAAERLFGLTSAQAVGRHISVIIPADRLEEERMILTRITGGDRLEHFETVRQHASGRRVPVSLTISPIKDSAGRVVAISKIARDISAQLALRARERDLLAESAVLETKFRVLFEQASLFALILDLDGTVIEANRLSCEGCGFAKEAVLGKAFWDGPWWAPSIALVEQIKGMTGQAMLGSSTREEVTYYTGGGVARIADVFIVPVKDAAGRVVLLAPTGIDITQRKRAEEGLRESEERFRTLADNLSQFAWMADRRGWIFWYNQRWFDYTGTTLEQMEGWGWTHVHHPDHRERVVARIQHSWDTGEDWEDTFPLRGRDGTYRWFLSRAKPIRDEHGAIVRWFGTNTDITDQRLLEDSLRGLTVQMVEADRRKDAFLATLSHELRTPLAALRNALGVMNAAPADATALETARGVMNRQVTQMARLLDDLLDVSRITRDRLTLQRASVDLAAVLRDAVETCRLAFEESGVHLSSEFPQGPMVLWGDASRLVQVFENLLTNAAKYTPRGGRVDLSVETSGTQVAVTVADTGVGIPRDAFSQIFELFTQVESQVGRAAGGLGIGLALVRRLVELHGGTVTAHSAGEGMGSRFVVRLNMDPVRAVDQPASGVEPLAASRRILVVDDEPDSAVTLALLLQAHGHHPEVARDGTAACAMAAEFRPEVILLDLGLPDMSGYDVCRQLRAQPSESQPFIVALTGWGQESDRQRTADAGFDLHIVKPVDPDELLRLLRTPIRP